MMSNQQQQHVEEHDDNDHDHDHEYDHSTEGLERIKLQEDASISKPLQLLYALNGASLSLPSTALMYIVNTRAAIPLAYLSVYGALAFLPFSLKPLYAHVSQSQTMLHRKHVLLTALFTCAAIATALTAAVPQNGVLVCIGLAVARGIAAAWSEFLLDLNLIDQARERTDSDCTTAAARFQSQAATFRGAGSMGANVVAVALLIQRQLCGRNEQDGTVPLVTVTCLLLITGAMNLVGAGIAWHHRVGGDSRASTGQYTPVVVTAVELPQAPSAVCCVANGDAVAIVTLQGFILVFAFRGLIESASSPLVWQMLVLMFVLVLTLNAMMTSWTKARRVGAFLICKHAMPGGGYIMGAYIYTLFESAPFLYQLLGLFNNFVTTMSSWSYGKVLATWSAGVRLRQVLAGTMVLGSMVALLNMLLTRLDSNHVGQAFVVVALVQVVTSVVGEWVFLPSVVLATTSVMMEPTVACELVPTDDEEEQVLRSSYQHSSPRKSCCLESTSSTTAMQYGTLISCIDFGDQIGSWLTVPLVAALGISRENEWEHLDLLILVTSALSLLPILLLPILREKGAEGILLN